MMVLYRWWSLPPAFFVASIKPMPVKPQAQPTGQLILDKTDHGASLLVKTTSGTRDRVW
jgi:hypothetical protein